MTEDFKIYRNFQEVTCSPLVSLFNQWIDFLKVSWVGILFLFKSTNTFLPSASIAKCIGVLLVTSLNVYPFLLAAFNTNRYSFFRPCVTWSWTSLYRSSMSFLPGILCTFILSLNPFNSSDLRNTDSELSTVVSNASISQILTFRKHHKGSS